MKTIGFIGTGVMGKSMIRHLLKKYKVVVYNRTKERALDLLEEGANWADTPTDVANAADVVLTIVGYPKDVEEVYFGDQGIFKSTKEHLVVVDLTTSTPTLAKRIAEEAAARSWEALDAPVSGGDLGAKNGTLSTMVGGTEETLEKVYPVLDCFSKTIALQGSAGAGQHTKMANQIMIAGTMTGLTEMLVYAKAAGLDMDKVLQTVGAGSAANWSLSNYGPRILKEDYSPGFFAKHFLKDLGIALDEAERMRLFLPATLQAKKL
ncbi:MAG: NAD(P)-dependent oxidoreductase, partial [Candidatus Granulicatella sp. P6S_S16_bin.50.1]|nr:NAD(P)-dependent oxidoreductase [Candidatus Granulicatella sp. P6S_S16_bin.50.1]